jgi:site-specific DNA-cytosine methylase
MKVLVACEFSGAVRDAFRARGHDAWSCDLLSTEADPEWHYHCPVEHLLHESHRWDLMIAHPPCTDLAVSGSRHFPAKVADGRQAKALAFVELLLNAPIPRIALENPVSIISTRIRPPDQTIQPWQFGHGEVKRTCLWLKNLPLLLPTAVEQMALGVTHKPITSEREARVHKMAPGPDRWRERSRTLTGIAEAMAEQWGRYEPAR